MAGSFSQRIPLRKRLWQVRHASRLCSGFGSQVKSCPLHDSTMAEPPASTWFLTSSMSVSKCGDHRAKGANATSTEPAPVLPVSADGFAGPEPEFGRDGMSRVGSCMCALWRDGAEKTKVFN